MHISARCDTQGVTPGNRVRIAGAEFGQVPSLAGSAAFSVAQAAFDVIDGTAGRGQWGVNLLGGLSPDERAIVVSNIKPGSLIELQEGDRVPTRAIMC